GEWSPQFPGWAFIQAVNGSGYWLHPQKNQEVETGTVLVLSHTARGTIRASQLGGLSLVVFCLDPIVLTGLLSLSEQRFFLDAANNPELSQRIFFPTTPLAERFRALSAQLTGNHNLFSRLQWLQLAVETFRTELRQQTLETTLEDPAGAK